MFDFFKRNKIKVVDKTPLPEALFIKFKRLYPQYSDHEVLEIESGLRDFFKLCILDKEHIIFMPSKCVDDLWHQFILFTNEYHDYCNKVFGNYLHHHPSVSKTDQVFCGSAAYSLAKSLDSLESRACSEPRLFTIDMSLSVEGCQPYDFNILKNRRSPFKKQKREDYKKQDGGCTAAFGSTSGGKTSDSSADGGCSGGCGGCG